MRCKRLTVWGHGVSTIPDALACALTRFCLPGHWQMTVVTQLLMPFPHSLLHAEFGVGDLHGFWRRCRFGQRKTGASTKALVQEDTKLDGELNVRIQGHAFIMVY